MENWLFSNQRSRPTRIDYQRAKFSHSLCENLGASTFKTISNSLLEKFCHRLWQNLPLEYLLCRCSPLFD